MLVYLAPHTEAGSYLAQPQLVIFSLFPHLQLGGQFNGNAGDPALQQALQTLVGSTLAPLAALNERVGKAADARPVPKNDWYFYSDECENATKRKERQSK